MVQRHRYHAFVAVLVLVAAVMTCALPPLPHQHAAESGHLDARTVTAGGCSTHHGPVPHLSSSRQIAAPPCLACAIGTRPHVICVAALRIALETISYAAPAPDAAEFSAPCAAVPTARGPPPVA